MLFSLAAKRPLFAVGFNYDFFLVNEILWVMLVNFWNLFKQNCWFGLQKPILIKALLMFHMWYKV